jgi:putative transposase
MSKELRHDRHTVSLLTDHIVFSPKYRGKVLVGDVAMLAEAILRKTCIELDIEVIDMAVNPDHVHLFIKYPPKYSVSYISKMIKGRSSRVLRKEFAHLKEWCYDHLWAPSCYPVLWVLAGTWLRSISRHTIHMSIIGSKYEKIAIYRPGRFVRGIPVCDCEMGNLCSVNRIVIQNNVL